VRQHHEKIDGSGYPLGLHDDQILIEAKILAVADIVESISAFRPYRPAMDRSRDQNHHRRSWQDIGCQSGGCLYRGVSRSIAGQTASLPTCVIRPAALD